MTRVHEDCSGLTGDLHFYNGHPAAGLQFLQRRSRFFRKTHRFHLASVVLPPMHEFSAVLRRTHNLATWV